MIPAFRLRPETRLAIIAPMRYLIPAAILLTVAGCAPPPRPVPVPTPTPSLRPVPTASPLPPPLPAAWNDWPFTPGEWNYRGMRGGYSSAGFGTPEDLQLSLYCDRSRLTISLAIPGDQSTPITVRTTAVTRTLSNTTVRGGAGIIPPYTIQADLAANDPLLDAMIFSRGRFVIDRAGQPPLVVRPFAELARVVEDCR